MEKFKALGINELMLKSIKDQHFLEPSEIQIKSVPLVLAGKDVIAGSATGSGKTLAFSAGIIEHCQKGLGIQSLIMTPTRELAMQVAQMIRKFSIYKPLRIVVVYGGASINTQISELRNADVVIGTPGRLLDHLNRRTINLSKVKILVLDEADRMLDMGFIRDVEKIIRYCPTQRQTLLFSATFPHEIINLSRRYMKNAVRVSAEQQVDPKKLSQFYYDVQDNMKFSMLVHLLKKEQTGLVMVFCNTQKTTDFVANNLKGSGVHALAIHGGLSQSKRNSIMHQFHKKDVYVLICTDVAARGLDIKGVSHVYNYDIPKDSKDYIHRIGRTARAGKEGKVINLISSRDHDSFSGVLRAYDVKIIKEKTPYIERVPIRWQPQARQRHQWNRGNFRGRGRRY